MAEPRRPITRRPPTPRSPARPPTPRHASTITRAPSSQRRAIRDIARRLIWWQTPDRALAQPRRFLAQVMALGTWDDIVAVRQVYGDDALRAVLADPPPGVFDPRSWHYWHAVFGIDPVPPLPRRFEGQRPDDDDRTATLIRAGTPLRSSLDTLTVEVDGVVLSFFGALNLGSVGVPEVAVENDVPVASLLDLAATKVKAVVDRAEAKDYLDVAAPTEAGIPLADALGAARAVFGPGCNEVLPLKALAFFEEGDLPSLPKSVQRRLIEAVTGVRQVPHFERRSNGLFPDEIERRLAMV